jgi:hypothetical protein
LVVAVPFPKRSPAIIPCLEFRAVECRPRSSSASAYPYNKPTSVNTTVTSNASPEPDGDILVPSDAPTAPFCVPDPTPPAGVTVDACVTPQSPDRVEIAGAETTVTGLLPQFWYCAR